MIPGLLFWFELLAVGVFAMTGAIVAARNRMDPIAFVMLATVTGIGGGTIRDMLLGVPAFWLADPVDLVVCIVVGVAVYLLRSTWPASEPGAGHRLLLWGDALGLALFAVAGAERAVLAGSRPVAAVVLGAISATFGGVIRDVLIGRTTLVSSREVYVTAAVVGATVYVVVDRATASAILPPVLGFIAGFAVRAGAIVFGWAYRT